MVSTTCVAGFPCAVLTVVKRPFPAFLPILLVAILLTSFPGPLPAGIRRWLVGDGNESAAGLDNLVRINVPAESFRRAYPLI